MKRAVVIFFTFISIALAADFPDGLWNGKPWDAAELKKKAEADESDAMAEWAFDA